MAGGDSDTNCAVAGSALGAFFGYSNLPIAWVDDLRNRDWLLAKANAAAYLILGEGDRYDHLSDKDTRIDGGKGETIQQDLERRRKAHREACARRRQGSKPSSGP